MIIHGKGDEEYCVDIKAQMNMVLMTDYMLGKYNTLLQEERDKRKKRKIIPKITIIKIIILMKN